MFPATSSMYILYNWFYRVKVNSPTENNSTKFEFLLLQTFSLTMEMSNATSSTRKVFFKIYIDVESVAEYQNPASSFFFLVSEKVEKAKLKSEQFN